MKGFDPYFGQTILPKTSPYAKPNLARSLSLEFDVDDANSVTLGVGGTKRNLVPSIVKCFQFATVRRLSYCNVTMTTVRYKGGRCCGICESATCLRAHQCLSGCD